MAKQNPEDEPSAPIDPDGPQPGSAQAPTNPEDSDYPAKGRFDPLPQPPAPAVAGGAVGESLPHGGDGAQGEAGQVTSVDAPAAVAGEQDAPPAEKE